MLVDPEEVKRLLPKKAAPFLSQNEASKRMSIPAGAVAALARGGTSSVGGSCGSGLASPINAIRPEDADALSPRYITLARAAEAMGLGRCGRIAREMIEAAGVRPAFDPEVVGCRIYERSAIQSDAKEN